MSYFYSGPMNNRKIELSNGHCFGLQQLLANSIENFIFAFKEKLLIAAQYLQSIKTFLIVSIASSCCCLQRLLQTRKHPVFVLTCLTSPSCAAGLSHCNILPSKLSILFWNSLQECYSDDRHWLEIGLKLEFRRLTNGY